MQDTNHTIESETIETEACTTIESYRLQIAGRLITTTKLVYKLKTN